MLPSDVFGYFTPTWNFLTMTDSTLPSVLFFNVYDPSHRAHLPAECITATQLRTFSNSVVTGISVQDTSSVIEIQPLREDSIEAQARCLLEDVAPQAFKVNHIFSIETLDVLASLFTDYAQIPLVTVFGKHFYEHVDIEDQDLYIEMLTDAYLDILAPLSHIAVIDLNYASQWTSEDFDISTEEDLFLHILDLGAEYCLILNQKDKQGNLCHRLIHQSDDEFLFEHPAGIHTPSEFADLVGTALACSLAQGVNAETSTQLALSIAISQLQNTIRIGMGKPQINHIAPELSPDRFSVAP